MNEDPINHVQGKHLLSEMYDANLGAFVKVTDTQIPHGSSGASITLGELVEVKNERNVSKSRELKTSVAVDSSGNPVFIERGGQYYFGSGELEKFSSLLTKSEQTTSASAGGPNGEFTSITSSLLKFDPAHAKHEDLQAVSFVSLYEFSLDDEGNLWKTEMRVSDYSSGGEPNLQEESRDVDSRRSIVSKRELAIPSGGVTSGQHNDDVCLPELVVETIEDSAPGLPEPGEEISYREMKREGKFRVRKITLVGWEDYERSWAESTEVRYPNIFEGFTGADFKSNFLNSSRRTDFTIHFSKLRTSKSVVCKVKHVESLKTEAQVQLSNVPPCFSLRPADWNYNGTLFNVQLPDVICDPAVITAQTNSDDTYYGYGGEVVTLPASEPSFSTFQSMITNGEEKLVSVRVQPWRFCLFKETKTYIVFAPF